MRDVLRNIRLVGMVALGAFIAVGAATAVMDTRPSRAAGLTRAPDLTAVEAFRAGPADDDGGPQTLVDFAFDEAAELSGGDRSNLHLVPLDGGDVIDARGVAPEDDEDADARVTVLFAGRLNPRDFARGFVDAATVSSPEAGDATLNVLQAADVANDGNSADPDLVSVTPHQGRLLYRFDQPLALGGGGDVQDTQGFTAYDDQATSVQAATAQPTDDNCHCEIAVTFDDFSVTNAVGASVSNGAVADRQHPAANNEPDEITVTDPGTGAAACPVESVTGDGDGPTIAPDLVTAGNFRPGPPNDDGNPTTCVDFTFDEPIALTGDRTNFHLIPVDGSDVVDATSQAPANDADGDARITAIFTGDLSAADFARGLADAGSGKRPDDQTSRTVNVRHTADISNDGNTTDPDLVSVTPHQGRLLYRFDQPLALGGGGDVQDTQGFTAYDDQATSVQAATAQPTDDNCHCEIAVTFDDFSVTNAVGASVSNGAVADRTNDDAINEPDEIRLERSATPRPRASR